MARTSRGLTTQPRLPQGVASLLPPDLRKQWDGVLAKFGPADEAARTANDARATANRAPAADQAAARQAARTGEKPPNATATDAETKAVEAERHARALGDVAESAQDAFAAALGEHRDAIRDVGEAELGAAIEQTTSLLRDVSEALDRVALLSGVVAWAERGGVGWPGSKRLVASMNGVEQTVDAYLDRVQRATDAEHPTALADRRAAQQAQQEAQRGIRHTADGLVVDGGSIRAIRSMGG